MPVNIQSRMWHVAGTRHQALGTVCHLLKQLDCLSAHSHFLALTRTLSLSFAPSFLVSRFDIFTNLICSVITETWVGQRTLKKGGWEMGGRVMSIRLIQGEQMRADAV